MTDQISVYAKSLVSTMSGDTNHVTLDEIDPSQVLAEFSDEEKLESMQLSSIHDWIQKKLRERDE